MHRNDRRIRRSAAAMVAVALTAGGTAGTASAQEPPAGTPAAVNTAEGKEGTEGAERAGKRLTLITGDQVLLDGRGRVAGVRPGRGRSGIPLWSSTAGGRTSVVPADAAPLITAGKLDRRLFDTGELSRAMDRAGPDGGLPLIVAYEGGGGAAKAARAGVRGAGDTRVRRTLGPLGADALSAPRADPARLWKTLTRERDGRRTVAAGISGIWLDGVRRATLDTSVGRVGAPAVWKQGFRGDGVTIAVLDTGVDATHPDLQGRVRAERNFTQDPDAKDRNGHGTHVASIAAGTGAMSRGTYTGVAPGAALLAGKVLDDFGGGLESDVIAGIDWAVAEGADIVNLSLGSADTPGEDPLEAHVDRVSRQQGTLFVVAAGNSGPLPGTVDSPGSADAALTVGAVDDRDRMAAFSGRGPRTGDSGLKPDVTAPGVAITAASAAGSATARLEGENPPGYVTLDGTSMATPHVAGAAALLKQKHPSWNGERLKAALTGSAKDIGRPAYEQGSGRVAADRALDGTVLARPSSLGFGVQSWPHGDDRPVTRTITYTNTGGSAVTLALSVSGTGPTGRPAPAGFFTLGAREVTVPAGGSTSVTVTADTRIGGTLDGHYSAAVTATGGGRTVRTAAAVDREEESYDLTVKGLGRDGRPVGGFEAQIAHWPFRYDPYRMSGGPSGVATVRLPRGTYFLNAVQRGERGIIDQFTQPQVDLRKDTTITLDARRTRPVSITVPDAGARETYSGTLVGRQDPGGNPDRDLLFGGHLESFALSRFAHLGPRVGDGTLVQSWHGEWERGSGTAYHIATGGRVDRVATGFTRKFALRDLAKVRAGLGAPGASRHGMLILSGWADGVRGSLGPMTDVRLGGVRTLYVSGSRARWDTHFEQFRDPGGEATSARYLAESRRFPAGRTSGVRFNTPVFGPAVGPGQGVLRQGDEIRGRLPVVADAAGHPGVSDFTSVRTVLRRGSTTVGENEDPLAAGSFTVGPEEAAYTLSTSVERAPEVSRAARRVDASWTFRSARPPGGTEVALPVSTVRFGVRTALDGTAPAGERQRVPVTVQGPAAGAGLKSLTVRVSYDSGRTWTKLPVTRGTVTLTNPGRGRALALRAQLADVRGNTASVTVHDAYHGG
ncbi:S8 family peptidase [Streptomyces yaizuensis]|uniref:S8 family serine peptidase n=1 Tax=Streptomyces yaizuensis TaxID=2989713 RepID=A0ABQ5NY43_9ACTN|nr:S8 family serine peptidase [Streptomyces sp. YSPA8]GLF94881.1 S8 family serine peptidase [Streptomyces sp. YSPA8]